MAVSNLRVSQGKDRMAVGDLVKLSSSVHEICITNTKIKNRGTSVREALLYILYVMSIFYYKYNVCHGMILHKMSFGETKKKSKKTWRKKHKACCKKYKPYILKYVPCVLK